MGELHLSNIIKGPLKPALFGVGTVEARRSYSIGPTRTGTLKQLLVDHGDMVQAAQARVDEAKSRAGHAGNSGLALGLKGIMLVQQYGNGRANQRNDKSGLER